jgi:osmotically inducible protein OsmC
MNPFDWMEKRGAHMAISQMTAVRRASATWSGDLTSGSGTVSAETTGVFRDLPVSWSARTEEPGGKTSPEELLASAHAACYSMAFSNGLAKSGHPPDRLDVTAEVTFAKQDAGWKVAASHVTVRGRVPGISEADFATAAEAAKDGCPISVALKGNVELSVEASLES